MPRDGEVVHNWVRSVSQLVASVGPVLCLFFLLLFQGSSFIFLSFPLSGGEGVNLGLHLASDTCAHTSFVLSAGLAVLQWDCGVYRERWGVAPLVICLALSG